MNRHRRRFIAAFLLILAGGALAAQGLLAADSAATSAADSEDDYPAQYTLITGQSRGSFVFGNGLVRIVAPNGTQVWSYEPSNTRIFDAEVTNRSTILVSTVTELPPQKCPKRFKEGGGCAKNKVVELTPGNKSVIWNYSWYDQFRRHHGVHDADRLANGRTAIADMGNHRAFVVDKAGNVTWQWNANESIAEGTPFQRQFGGPNQEGPESDWTHINDIDRTSDGNFDLSIRNFDVVLEVDPKTNEIVGVVGEPGNHTMLNRQHNPDRIEHAGTMVVADSENNRVVELDVSTGKVLWSYYAGSGTQHLAWPRDADRLQNGNTLITDSRNFRVIEVTPAGRVVWKYDMRGERGILYEADRLNVSATTSPERLRTAFSDAPEEPDAVPSARDFPDSGGVEGRFVRFLYGVSTWAGYFVPWMGLPETLTSLVGILAAGWLGGESIVDRLRSRR